ncbi:unnamed protein product, partial [Mesorhabditis spiculigera]
MNADRAAITDVQNQLNNQFLPAVKSMGAAGAELLRAFQALQRSTDAYCTSLAQLARSAKGASPAAENYGKQLLETSKQFRDTMQHHERSVANFSVFANKTNRFSTGEKDVLKEMASRFAKDEKEFLKTKPSAEASGKFYAKEREYFVKQQELRYKFFFDRHEEWFKTPLPVYAADPKPTPAARTVPVVVPSPFSAQDYGVSLEVNEDYSPSGPDQLSVVRGDRVTLIKSGNRGWIFIKDASGNRTGWIPAQFASKV